MWAVRIHEENTWWLYGVPYICSSEVQCRITVWENEAARNTSFPTLHDSGGRNGKNVIGIPTTVAV